ncbi:hypothetical protein F8566_49465 [Actinomadura rudentiformis]|uniref:Uncharacterized protein n=1 Tax=Actinomadura rudentiformis TaxID=359158 RepID=A0A6H9Y8S5_9ACTN|nr:hypothetical protein F8566_49465 [Actinomadura rudentiformis]
MSQSPTRVAALSPKVGGGIGAPAATAAGPAAGAAAGTPAGASAGASTAGAARRIVGTVSATASAVRPSSSGGPRAVGPGEAGAGAVGCGAGTGAVAVEVGVGTGSDRPASVTAPGASGTDWNAMRPMSMGWSRVIRPFLKTSVICTGASVRARSEPARTALVTRPMARPVITTTLPTCAPEAPCAPPSIVQVSPSPLAERIVLAPPLTTTTSGW